MYPTPHAYEWEGEDEWHGPCLCTFYAKGWGIPLGISADGSASGQLKADANDDPGGHTLDYIETLVPYCKYSKKSTSYEMYSVWWDKETM